MPKLSPNFKKVTINFSYEDSQLLSLLTNTRGLEIDYRIYSELGFRVIVRQKIN